MGKACQEDTSGHTWCRAPAGCFIMGSPPSDTCREKGVAKEKETEHEVTLTNAFVVSSTETTQGQFLRHMGYNPSHFSTCGRVCPVESVSWPEARAHCNALSRARGIPPCYTCTGWASPVAGCPDVAAYAGKKSYRCPGYRLPTEAEFEYAYRSGSKAAYHSGANDTSLCTSSSTPDPNAAAIAWYSVNSGKKTHPSGKKQANAWGLHDMAGNVWEWIHDGYTPDLGKTKVTDPWTFSTTSLLRGGAYPNHAESVRAARRQKRSTAASSGTTVTGFRCVRTVDPGLLAHWQLDGAATDSKGGYKGTLTGGKWVKGVSGKALEGDGKSSSLHVPAKGALSFNPAKESYAVAAWIKPVLSNSGGEAWAVFDRQLTGKGPTSYQLGVSLTPGTNQYKVVANIYDGKSSAQTYDLFSSRKVTAGAWTHVAVVVKGNDSHSLYVNGVLEASKSIAGIKYPGANTGGVTIGAGAYPAGLQHFNGAIDDVRIYDRALGAGEVLELAQQKPCDWTPVRLKDMPAPRRSLGATEAVDGKIYLLGGSVDKKNVFLQTVHSYDIWTNTYKSLGIIMPHAAFIRPHAIARGDDGRFYMAPPQPPATGRKNVVVFDPTGLKPKAYESKAAFGTSTYSGQAAVNGGNGKIYFLGGWGSGGATSNVWELDPKTENMVVVSTKYPKGGGGASEGAVLASDGKIYVFNSAQLQMLVIFDPKTYAITSKPYPGKCSAHDITWEYPRGVLHAPCDGFKQIISYSLSVKTLSLKPMSPVFGSAGSPHAVTVDRNTGAIFTFGGDFDKVYGTRKAYRLDCMKH